MRKFILAGLAAFLLGTAAMGPPAEARCWWNVHGLHCWYPRHSWWRWHHHRYWHHHSYAWWRHHHPYYAWRY
ncbi:MAG: hypothetical protein ACREFH_09175 [Stellaceae bacterium]